MPADHIALHSTHGFRQISVFRRIIRSAAGLSPGFTATVKTYEYRILNRTFADPTRRLNSISATAHWMWMRCGRHRNLVGMHDFQKLCNSKTGGDRHGPRTIYETSFGKEDDLIRCRSPETVSLQYGAGLSPEHCFEVGKGDYPPEKVKEILAAARIVKDGRSNGQAGSDPWCRSGIPMGIAVKI